MIETCNFIFLNVQAFLGPQMFHQIHFQIKKNYNFFNSCVYPCMFGRLNLFSSVLHLFHQTMVPNFGLTHLQKSYMYEKPHNTSWGRKLHPFIITSWVLNDLENISILFHPFLGKNTIKRTTQVSGCFLKVYFCMFERSQVKHNSLDCHKFFGNIFH